jgi:hypothetical protein
MSSYILKIDKNSSIIISEKDSLVNTNEQFIEGITPTGALENIREKVVGKLQALPEATADKVCQILVAFSKKFLDEFSKEFKDKQDVSFTVEYGVNLVENLDLQLASSSTEANIKITAEWHQ